MSAAVRLIGAVLLGAGLGWLLPSAPAPAPEAQPAPPPVVEAPAPEPEPPAPCPVVVPDGREAALRAELDALRVQTAALRARSDAREGPIQGWGGRPADEQPSAVEGALAEVIGEVDGADLLWLDCDEWPCVAIIASPGQGDDSGASVAADALRERYPGSTQSSQVTLSGGQLTSYLTLGLTREDVYGSAELAKRLAFRGERAWEDAQPEVQAWMAGATE